VTSTILEVFREKLAEGIRGDHIPVTLWSLWHWPLAVALDQGIWGTRHLAYQTLRDLLLIWGHRMPAGRRWGDRRSSGLLTLCDHSEGFWEACRWPLPKFLWDSRLYGCFTWNLWYCLYGWSTAQTMDSGYPSKGTRD